MTTKPLIRQNLSDISCLLVPISSSSKLNVKNYRYILVCSFLLQDNFFLKADTLPFGNDDGIGKPLEAFEPPSEIESPTKILEILFVTLLCCRKYYQDTEKGHLH